jgi:hypothetical protein
VKVHVGFVMEKMALGQVSLQAFSPANSHSTMLHIHLSGAESGQANLFVLIPIKQLQSHFTGPVKKSLHIPLIHNIKLYTVLSSTHFVCNILLHDDIFLTLKESCGLQLTAMQH